MVFASSIKNVALEVNANQNFTLWLTCDVSRPPVHGAPRFETQKHPHCLALIRRLLCCYKQRIGPKATQCAHTRSAVRVGPFGGLPVRQEQGLQANLKNPGANAFLRRKF